MTRCLCDHRPVASPMSGKKNVVRSSDGDRSIFVTESSGASPLTSYDRPHQSLTKITQTRPPLQDIRRYSSTPKNIGVSIYPSNGAFPVIHHAESAISYDSFSAEVRSVPLRKRNKLPIVNTCDRLVPGRRIIGANTSAGLLNMAAKTLRREITCLIHSCRNEWDSTCITREANCT
ncbi:hypothetical protein DPMN_127951 [Dreissena polymorpha]|uniref:Uncharacterized protein n=1 Tax=Dreissena polymorpha TaxID=45954 RepID=A0A9D4H073_DREPO|nr:hypothetical protein DPMN_127951 [Dreissena polymorpha]